MDLIDMDKEISKVDEKERLVMPLESRKVEKILRSVQNRKASDRHRVSNAQKKKQKQKVRT
jgi:hypothetical protein